MANGISTSAGTAYVSTRLIAPRRRIVAFESFESRSLPLRLFARLLRWMDTRRGRLDLLVLSDYQLKDIGLSRGEAYNDFYKHDV